MVLCPINRIVGVVPTTEEAAMTITEPLKAIHGRSIDLIQNGVDGEELTVDELQTIVAALISGADQRSSRRKVTRHAEKTGHFAFPYLRCGPSSRERTYPMYAMTCLMRV
jgi:hypothetical protein